MQKLKRFFVIGVAALAIIIFNLHEARACSCLPPPPPAKAFAEADAVFIGKVVSFELTGDAFSSRLAKFSITKIWKGERSAVSEILTANNSAACGYEFLIGESYIIYAYQASDGKLHTNICTRTRPARLAAEDLKYLATAASFPLAIGNTWTFLEKPTQQRHSEKIKDSLRIAGRLYFRFDRFREIDNAWLRMADDGKLFMRLDTTEQVWLDFGAKIGDRWPVTTPNKFPLWAVELQSKTDTIKTAAGTFVQCFRFHFYFIGTDNDWEEWYAFNVGPVKRSHWGFASFEYPLESAIINGVPTSVDEGPVDEPIRHFALLQNYPNPFVAAGNSATAIRYRLNAATPVQLNIYDMLGREIRTLVQQHEPAGEHVAVWDGANMAGEKAPNGIYFYRLQIGKHIEVRKLVLTR